MSERRRLHRLSVVALSVLAVLATSVPAASAQDAQPTTTTVAPPVARLPQPQLEGPNGFRADVSDYAEYFRGRALESQFQASQILDQGARVDEFTARWQAVQQAASQPLERATLTDPGALDRFELPDTLGVFRPPTQNDITAIYGPGRTIDTSLDNLPRARRFNIDDPAELNGLLAHGVFGDCSPTDTSCLGNIAQMGAPALQGVIATNPFTGLAIRESIERGQAIDAINETRRLQVQEIQAIQRDVAAEMAQTESNGGLLRSVGGFLADSPFTGIAGAGLRALDGLGIVDVRGAPEGSAAVDANNRIAEVLTRPPANGCDPAAGVGACVQARRAQGTSNPIGTGYQTSQYNFGFLPPAAGPLGPQGPQGPAGITGPAGPADPATPPAATNPSGPQGVQGPQGPPTTRGGVLASVPAVPMVANPTLAPFAEAASGDSRRLLAQAPNMSARNIGGALAAVQVEGPAAFGASGGPQALAMFSQDLQSFGQFSLLRSGESASTLLEAHDRINAFTQAARR